jgi:predicted nucleic acid-binding protein
LRVDLDRLLRRTRTGRETRRLQRRNDTALVFADSVPLVGSPLLVDTNVYIDVYDGSAPTEVKRLLSRRPIYHLDLVLGELAQNFGRLAPDHPGTADLLSELYEIFEAIPPERIETASSGTVVEAGIMAGLLFRLGGLQPGREVAALVDAILHLHALERGYTLLTRNIRDFNFLDQLRPSDRVILYRRTPE